MYAFQVKRIAAFCAAAWMVTGCGLPATSESAFEPLALMCLGDSITDGFWLTGGYRNTLCEQISANGLESQIDFVGPNWGGSGYDPQHAGYSGYSIDNIAQEDSISGQRTGLYSFIDYLMETYPADVVFLQIGTNDILSYYDLDHFGDRLELLVDAILETLPADGMLYLATLPCMDATNSTYINAHFFTAESMDATVAQCNTQIRALAEQKQAEGASISLAEVNGVLTKEDLYDGVHPSEEGYQKLGLFWYETLQQYLQGTTTTPVVTTAPSSETTTTETKATAEISGDVNLDGSLSIADAAALLRYLTEGTPLTPDAALQADLNGDQHLNAVDLTCLKRRFLQTGEQNL